MIRNNNGEIVQSPAETAVKIFSTRVTKPQNLSDLLEGLVYA